jgi:hypothetical protein
MERLKGEKKRARNSRQEEEFRNELRYQMMGPIEPNVENRAPDPLRHHEIGDTGSH